MTQNFNYAGMDPAGDRLACLKIDENKPVLVSFLENIPQMQSPPFVYAKVHWIQEMGENGRLIQCFGGACCEQVTWQKGWGGEPGKFATTKARTRYYIPVVHYEPDPQNPAVARATVKYLDLTWTAFNALCVTIQNTEGISFFQRDVLVTAQKVNGATTYIYDKRDGQAQWLTNAIFKQQIEEQLPEVAQKLMAAMPPLMTEAEFMEIKPQLDAKVQAAMGTHTIASTQQVAQQINQFAAFPAAQPVVNTPAAQPMAAQPVVNIPATPAAQPVTNIPVAPAPAPAVNITLPVEPVVSGIDTTSTVAGIDTTSTVANVDTAVAPETKFVDDTVQPAISLDFDPSALMK